MTSRFQIIRGALSRYLKPLLLTTIAFYFLILPALITISNLFQLKNSPESIQPFVFDWHQSLSPNFEAWASKRVASAAAANLSINNISGTEWPMFSAVYYLWTTEALQDAWEADNSLAQVEPRIYAAAAIEASALLIADPNNATWVKQHWGDDYLQQENLFYRMLLISGLTSYQKLTDNPQYKSLLRSQVKSLSAEIDDSPYGMLDDYPGQYYSIDMLPAIAAIQRADTVLGSDHGEFVQRARRAFISFRLDPLTNLPTYSANADTGIGRGPARGVGLSYMLIWVPELWPEMAGQWYTTYDQHFWQPNAFFVGFRELSNQLPAQQWFLDVDAGPVLGGYGTTATAFGIGAARVNGRLDQSYPLTAQALAISWPLPNGTRLAPRLLSNLTDAPFTGETALLFTLTRQPNPNTPLTSKGSPPIIVYLILALQIGLGSLMIYKAYSSITHQSQVVGSPHNSTNRHHHLPPQAQS